MSWLITRVSGKDFGSFRSFSYDFKQSLYIVRGTNEDATSGDFSSNGAGKTSFIDTIPVCLFGVSLANRKLYSCVREGWSIFYVISPPYSVAMIRW